MMKLHREKSYHPMCLTIKKQEIFNACPQVENIPESCIIESNNCSSQYKSAQHFDNIQNICYKIGFSIICLFNVTRHGKGKVDHAGGLAKCCTRWYVGTGVWVLGTKFAEKPNPKLILKVIDVDDMADSRAEARLKKYLTIEGSDSVQVMVVQPNSTTFKDAFHLCICDQWFIDYGSCSLFSSHELRTQTLKKIFLASEMEINGQNSNDQAEDVSNDFILADTYWVISWECLVY